jgi:hypothetical protein
MSKKAQVIVEQSVSADVDSEGVSSTSKTRANFANSPIHKRDLTDVERSKAYAGLLINFESGKPWDPAKPHLSMKNATAYWRLENVNVMFRPWYVFQHALPQPPAPEIYAPAGTVVSSDLESWGAIKLPPLSSFVPNFLSPSQIDPPEQPYPAKDSKTLAYVKTLYDDASPENKSLPGFATAKSQINSAIQHGLSLGVYALGKSGYTEEAFVVGDELEELA